LRLYRRVAGLAAVTALSLGAAACGIAEAAVDAAAAVDATAKLLAAVPGESAPSFAYATKGGCVKSFSGVTDAPAKAAKMVVTDKIPHVGSATVTYLVIGADKSFLNLVYKPAKLHAESGIPKGWLTVDQSRLGDESKKFLVYNKGYLDPLGVSGLVPVTSGVIQDGARFTGTLDLTRTEKGNRIIADDTVSRLGEQAKSVPFEAVVDEGTGIVTSWTIKTPGAVACTITYDKFGATNKLSAPKAKKAPAVLYRLLNS
jgi:hypothetical protein